MSADIEGIRNRDANWTEHETSLPTSAARDRTRTECPMVDPAYFPDCDGGWIWTATDDLTPPAGYAWLVDLNDGSSLPSHQGIRNQVRAVRA